MFLFAVRIIFFCLYASICSFSSNGRITLPKDVSISAVIVFGDSFVDQGNNNYIKTLAKANFLPYGKDFVGEKPTGRFSNGKTLPDFLGVRRRKGGDGFRCAMRELWLFETISGSRRWWFPCKKIVDVFLTFSLEGSNGTIILPKDVSVSAVIVFGDSFVDQGNNNYINTLAKANFPPYGKDFVGEKPTGRFSNGKTPPDFLAKAFGVKDYLPAYLDPSLNAEDLQTGVSFGSAASGIDPLTSTATSTISFSAQLDMFKEYINKLKRIVGEEASNNIIKNSVVVVVASTNDLTLSLPLRRSQYDAPAYIDMLVKIILSFLQELNTLGARRIVVFSAPPYGCFPTHRTLAGGLERKCHDEKNNIAQSFNTILLQQLQISASSFPESRVAIVDFYNPFLNIIENPQNYGFKVTDRGCCGTGELEVTYLCNRLKSTCLNDSEFFFWDSFHPSEKGYEIFVNLILHGLVNKLF